METKEGIFSFEIDSGPVNWFESLAHCHSLCEDCFLAEIHTEETWEILKNYSIFDLEKKYGFWVGANDLRQVKNAILSSIFLRF